MDASNLKPDERAPVMAELVDLPRFPEENPNPVFRVAHDGRLEYTNPASKHLLTSLHATNGCIPPPWAGRILEALALGAVQEWDVAVGEPDSGRQYHLHCVPIPHAGSVNVYASDITERERLLRELARQAAEIRDLNADLERRVQERTAELEAIFASVPDALFVTDHEGIVRANRAAMEAVRAQTLAEFRERTSGLLRDEGVRDAATGRPFAKDETVLSHALRGERVVRELVARRPDTGEDVFYRSAGAPIIVNGEITGSVGLVSDITPSKLLEKRLAYQALVLDNVFDAVIAFDMDLRITAWNRAAEQQYGWRADEVLGRPLPEIVRSQVSEEQRQARLRAMAETGRWQGETVHLCRDGSPLHIEATSIAIYDGDGVPAGFVSVNRNITRRKEAEAQNARLMAELEAGREEMRRLSRRLVALQEDERSYVADQLVNQAGQVLAALQWQLSVSGVSSDGAAGQQSLRGALTQAMRDLHDLAANLRPMALDFSTLARVLESHVMGFGETHGLGILVDAGDAEDLALPREIATALFRAVQDGLSNVARHAKASAVDLILQRHGGLLTVILSDNGCGFDPAGPDGHGLGLAAMRERLESVGGLFTVESGAGGTTLRFLVPIEGAQG